MEKEDITSTQKGVIAENIVANELIIQTDGRFSPFSPITDEEIDLLLIYDKKTGKALPLQIKKVDLRVTRYIKGLRQSFILKGSGL